MPATQLMKYAAAKAFDALDKGASSVATTHFSIVANLTEYQNQELEREAGLDENSPWLEKVLCHMGVYRRLG